MNYFIAIKGKKKGPYTFEQLKDLDIYKNTLVWKDGMENWLPAGKIKELEDIAIKPPPPLPKGKISVDEILKIFFIHLLLGFGFFYVDKSIQRKYIYPFFGTLALIDLLLGPVLDIEPFADTFGLVIFIICLIICYVFGYIDVYYHRYRISKEEQLNHESINS